jgi:hypothetical protein
VQTRNIIWIVIVLITLASCGQSLWVKPGGTTAEFEVAKGRCLAAAYSQVPSAPAVATFDPGYQSPLVTNCSTFGNTVSCITPGGQYMRPLAVPYDANAGVRNEVFRGCMYGDGWSLQQQQRTRVVADSDWRKGLNWGVKNSEGAACSEPPQGVSKPKDWTLGCRTGIEGSRKR